MNLDFLQKYELLLGSKSPRRQALLKALGLHYKLVDIDVEENFPSELQAEEIALFLSLKKADAFELGELHDNQILITADTIVWLDNESIGKPEDKNEAILMLRKLSGKRHKVFTGICLKTVGYQSAFYTETVVEFDELQDDDIAYYIEHHKPFDKAGSYGIQDWIGYIGIKGIEGCYYNVMGFPVQKFYVELKKFIQKLESI